jgi:RNA polymerase sigma-70 factor (ECF subfamily)
MGPDDDLLRGAKAGEPLALKRLLLAHGGPLRTRIARGVPARFRSLLAPEDILQETFAEAFRTIGGFEPQGKDAFYRWLSTIADHRLLDAIRSLKTVRRGGGHAPAVNTARSSIANLVDIVAVTTRTPSRAARGHENTAAVQVALAGLRPEHRDALTLRYLQGLPIAEVAVRMGKTESAVHKLCSRALQGLRKSMGEAANYLSRA